MWKKSDILRFQEGGPDSSMVDDKSETTVKVVSLDEYLDGNPINLITMDVEGAELNTLKGAEAAIKRYKPK